MDLITCSDNIADWMGEMQVYLPTLTVVGQRPPFRLDGLREDPGAVPQVVGPGRQAAWAQTGWFGNIYLDDLCKILPW
eukprot:11930620-Heterocapsa_arctica.AAC.1